MVLLLGQRLLTVETQSTLEFDSVDNFSERFLSLRKRLGLDQATMAARLMISRNYLSQIENGREPHMRLLELLGHLEKETKAGQHGDTVNTAQSTRETPNAAPASNSAAPPPRRKWTFLPPFPTDQETEQTLRPLPSPADLANESQALFERLVALAGDDVSRQHWLREQLRAISPPRHWIAEDKWDASIKRMFEEMRAERPSAGAEETGA